MSVFSLSVLAAARISWVNLETVPDDLIHSTYLQERLQDVHALALPLFWQPEEE